MQKPKYDIGQLVYWENDESMSVVDVYHRLDGGVMYLLKDVDGFTLWYNESELSEEAQD